MGKWISFSLILFLAIFQYGKNYWFTHWYLKWTVLLMGAAVAYSVAIGKRVHWSTIPVFASTLLSGLYVFHFRDNAYASFSLLDRVTISKTVATTTLSFLLLASLFALLPKTRLKDLGVAFGGLCLLNSLKVILETLTGSEPFMRGGFLSNASMNACVIAYTYPMAWELSNRIKQRVLWWGAMALPPLAIFFTYSSMAYGVLFVTCLGAGLPWAVKRFSWQKLLPLGVGLPLAFVLFGMFVMGSEELFHSSGRLMIWRLALEYFWEEGNLLLGVGPGVSEVLLSYLQSQTHRADMYQTEYFMFLHNDWLQVLFEQGIFGLLSYLLAFFYALKFSFGKPQLLASLLGLGACALGNFPSHNPMAALAGLTIVALCFREGEKDAGGMLRRPGGVRPLWVSWDGWAHHARVSSRSSPFQ